MMVYISQVQLSLDFDLDIDTISQLRNLTVVDPITVIPPNDTMVPSSYSSLSQYLSHHDNDILVILPSKKLLPVVLFCQIINSPEFEYIIKNKSNKNNNIKDIIYENLQENNGLIAVPGLFRGSYNILSPVLKDYLPELKRTAVVKVKDKHKNNHEIIVKFFLSQQIEKEKNITYTLPDVDALNFDLAGENLTFRNLREILDSFRGLENSNVLREVNQKQFLEMMRSGKMTHDSVPSMAVWYQMYLAVHQNIYKQFYELKFDNLPFVHLENNITNTKVQRARFNTKNVSNIITPSSLEQGFQTDIESLGNSVSAGKNLEQFDHSFNLFKSFPHFREANKKKTLSQNHSQQDKGEEATINYLLEQRKHHVPSENSYANVATPSKDVDSNEFDIKALQNIHADNENNSTLIKLPHDSFDFIKEFPIVENVDDNLLIRKFPDVVPFSSAKIIDNISNNVNETFASSTNLTSVNTTKEKVMSYESTILKNLIDTTNIDSRKENIISTAIPVALTHQTTDKAEITINSIPLAAPMKSINLITNNETDMVDENFLSSVNQIARPNFINKNDTSECENYTDLITGNFSLGNISINDLESQATDISVEAESSGINEESSRLRNTTDGNYLVEKIPYESVFRMTSAIFNKHQEVPIGKNCTEACSVYYVKLNGREDEISSLENGFLLFPVIYSPMCNKTGILQLLPFQELSSKTLDSDHFDTMKQKEILQSNNSNNIFYANQLFRQEKETPVSNSLVSSMLFSKYLDKFKENHPRNGNPKLEQNKQIVTEIEREHLGEPLKLKLKSDVVSLPNKNNQQLYPNLILRRRLNFSNYATPETQLLFNENIILPEGHVFHTITHENDMLKPSVNKNLSPGKENQQFQRRRNSQKPSLRRLKTMLRNNLNKYSIKDRSNVQSSRNSNHVN